MRLTAPAAAVVGSFWAGLGALPRRARFVRFWPQQRWQQLGGVPANGRWPVQNVAVQVVLLRWHDRPLMRPTAGAAFAGALLSIRMRVGRGRAALSRCLRPLNGQFITMSAEVRDEAGSKVLCS